MFHSNFISPSNIEELIFHSQANWSTDGTACRSVFADDLLSFQ